MKWLLFQDQNKNIFLPPRRRDAEKKHFNFCCAAGAKKIKLGVSAPRRLNIFVLNYHYNMRKTELKKEKDFWKGTFMAMASPCDVLMEVENESLAQEILNAVANEAWRIEDKFSRYKEGKVIIKLLYFIELARISGKDEEEVTIPESVTNVETLLSWMRKRGERWKEPFADNRLQVTVNKQFSEPYTLVEHGDEVAFVPRPK